MKKPFIFVGDSITWGEGLELYNDEFRNFYQTISPDKKFNFWIANDILFSGFAPMCREMNRFANKVASHYDNICISNGITSKNIDSFEYVKEMMEKYGKDNFSSVIINLTSTIHDEHITSKKQLLELFDLEFEPFQLQKILQRWYDYATELGINSEITSDVDVFEQIFHDANIDVDTMAKLQAYFFQPDNFRNFLVENSYSFYEERIKWFIDNDIDIHFLLPWQRHDFEDYKKLIQKFDLDITKHAIDIVYDGISYDSLAELSDIDELWIINDYPWSESIFISPKGHEIVTESIIKHLDSL